MSKFREKIKEKILNGNREKEKEPPYYHALVTRLIKEVRLLSYGKFNGYLTRAYVAYKLYDFLYSIPWITDINVICDLRNNTPQIIGNNQIAVDISFIDQNRNHHLVQIVV